MKKKNTKILGKDTINNWIIPFLSVGKRGFKSNFDLASIFLLILKRLKTGVQWRELPIESYFEKGGLMDKIQNSKFIIIRERKISHCGSH